MLAAGAIHDNALCVDDKLMVHAYAAICQSWHLSMGHQIRQDHMRLLEAPCIQWNKTTLVAHSHTISNS
eukprot:scaffold219809_cov19-Prasinocladus_malaysianus.AAC.2